MKLKKIAIASIATLAFAAQPLLAQQAQPAGTNAPGATIGGVAAPVVAFGVVAAIVVISAISDSGNSTGTTGTR